MENDLDIKVALYASQTQKLEQAHTDLLERFTQLRAKLDTYHQTLEHISDGLIFVTLKGEITLFNRAAAAITGEALELPATYWNHFSDALFGFPLGYALKNGHTPGRILLSFSNGKEVEVAPTYIPDKGLLLLLNDRTELKQLETSVQQSDRLKALGEMAATLAHEIRNPLGGIEGFASLLKRELEEPKQQEMVRAILEGSRSLNTLVTNVLDYARPLTLHFEPTDLAALIAETMALAQASGLMCSAVIEKQRTSSVDRKRLQLVLLNLVRNACEAGATHVEIILTSGGKIEVHDNGEGMSVQEQEKIFTPFFTTKTTGTGLGLAEAYNVMKAHGGSLTVESSPGHGTKMIIDDGN